MYTLYSYTIVVL